MTLTPIVEFDFGHPRGQVQRLAAVQAVARFQGPIGPAAIRDAGQASDGERGRMRDEG